MQLVIDYSTKDLTNSIVCDIVSIKRGKIDEHC